MTNPNTSPPPSNGTPDEGAPEPESVEVDLKPKSLPKLAPEGIRTFTVCRRSDETGISGEGIVIEGVTLATGQCIVHWLYPTPRGGIAIFDSMTDFIKVHIESHPSNNQDGEQELFGESVD